MTFFGLFLTVLFTVFIAEMGDKTQLMLIAMTSRYKVRHIILGTAVAILVLNGLAVAVGGALNQLLTSYLWVVRLVACAAFFYFSVTSLMKDDDEEEAGESGFKFAPLAVFCTFFVAELGDKTQLASITFGATDASGLYAGLIIWAGASIGLFAADMIGLLVGILLHGKTPDSFFNWLAFAIFAVFGFVNLPEGLYLALAPVQESEPGWLDKINLTPHGWAIMAAVFCVFAIICVTVIIKQKKSSQTEA